jgi:hypothetical protein
MDVQARMGWEYEGRLGKIQSRLFITSAGYMPNLLQSTRREVNGRRYAVLPTAQQAILTGKDFTLAGGWQLRLEGGVKAGDVAIESLREVLSTRYRLDFTERSGHARGGLVRLAIETGSV